MHDRSVSSAEDNCAQNSRQGQILHVIKECIMCHVLTLDVLLGLRVAFELFVRNSLIFKFHDDCVSSLTTRHTERSTHQTCEIEMRISVSQW